MLHNINYVTVHLSCRTLVLLFLHIGTCSSNNFKSLTTCTCLGQNVTYECTASGGTFTVWTGSAFMCPSEEIALIHVRFLAAVGACNNGAIFGKGVSSTNSNYTSHLTVMLQPELVGRSITCSVDIGDLISIGTGNLTISKGSCLIACVCVYYSSCIICIICCLLYRSISTTQ